MYLRRWVPKALAAAAMAGVVIQFIPTAPRTNPPVVDARRAERHLQFTPEAKGIIDRACKDCHTNETRWPWYSRVAPVSWSIVRDVNGGRSVMNFSEWSTQAGRRPDIAATMLAASCLALKNGVMPRYPYALFHPEARLSKAEIERFCAWTAQEFARLSIEHKRNQRAQQLAESARTSAQPTE